MNKIRKMIAVFSVLAVGGVASGCTPEQRAANMQKARDVLAAVNAGVRVTAEAVKQGIDAVCENQAAVASAAMVTRVGLSTQSGPNTAQNLANLDRSLATLNQVCAQAAANPNDPAMKSLLRTAITSYNAAVRVTGG